MFSSSTLTFRIFQLTQFSRGILLAARRRPIVNMLSYFEMSKHRVKMSSQPTSSEIGIRPQISLSQGRACTRFHSINMSPASSRGHV